MASRLYIVTIQIISGIDGQPVCQKDYFATATHKKDATRQALELATNEPEFDDRIHPARRVISCERF